MGAYAVDLLIAGKTKRVVGYKNGEYVDFDINEALAMQKSIPEYQYEIAKALSYNYVKLYVYLLCRRHAGRTQCRLFVRYARRRPPCRRREASLLENVPVSDGQRSSRSFAVR